MEFTVEVPQSTVDTLTADAITAELSVKLAEMNNRAIAKQEKTLGEAMVKYAEDPTIAAAITKLGELEADDAQDEEA